MGSQSQTQLTDLEYNRMTILYKYALCDTLSTLILKNIICFLAEILI